MLLTPLIAMTANAFFFQSIDSAAPVLQMAEMLMMHRPEGEGASDFQDYTLIAVIAVAAHLTGGHQGQQQQPYLSALARRFSQDAAALHQVFCACFIIIIIGTTFTIIILSLS